MYELRHRRERVILALAHGDAFFVDVSDGEIIFGKNDMFKGRAGVPPGADGVVAVGFAHHVIGGGGVALLLPALQGLWPTASDSVGHVVDVLVAHHRQEAFAVVHEIPYTVT